ncbi:hypothetical protein ACQ3I4_09595 [Zafaria sp. Z1313]|uniref:hypothetical protein n=1 Tax=unclassified Zafaria TaxID=2828765 RepID=UPI002E7920FD|nr:hypothetical protein [Zafaria sp. J156]MEE1621828.1 hypothetical protein [Zafaria sp. J156]
MAPGGASARRSLPPTSYLRVFQPLRAYDDGAQARISAQGALARPGFEERVAAEAVQRLLRPVSDPFPRGTEGYRVLHYPLPEGVTAAFYCPEQLQVRATLASEQLDGTMRPQLLEMLVPDAARAVNAARLGETDLAGELGSLQTRGATWAVPFAWFVLLREDDHREVDEDGDRVLGVRLSAPMVQVLERARYAAASLAVHAPELDLLDELTALVEWMKLFHHDSIVELDYGGLAEFVWPDDSPHDLRMGIESLSEGDMLGAAAAYRRLTTRWLKVRQLGRAN